MPLISAGILLHRHRDGVLEVLLAHPGGPYWRNRDDASLLVLTALFYFGGETFYSFTLALIFGIIVGTYSTIFIATPVSLMMGLTREDLLPLKEKQPIDDMP